jgi:O-antigen ligase
MKELQHSSGLIFIPLAVYSCNSLLDLNLYRRLMNYFIAILFSACFYCLIIALREYIETGKEAVFFYHDLVEPISQHAILFSILIFVGQVFLFECLKQNNTTIRKISLCILIAYFSLFLILLSSKLVLILYLLWIIFFVIAVRKRIVKAYLVILPFFILLTFGALILGTKNPISKRFQEITSGNIALFKQKKFTQGDYFNGLQFRLLQWRFVYEILNDNHSWLVGVSPGDAQSYLDQKYLSTDMYVGKIKTTDRGFLGYNTHNQFLQCLLEIGIVGLATFTFVYYTLLVMIFKYRIAELTFTIIPILAFCLTDAVLETQYGIFLFTFFPCFLLASFKDYSPKKQI